MPQPKPRPSTTSRTPWLQAWHSLLLLLLVRGSDLQLLQLCMEPANFLLVCLLCGSKHCMTGGKLLLQLACPTLSFRQAVLQELRLGSRSLLLLLLHALVRAQLLLVVLQLGVQLLLALLLLAQLQLQLPDLRQELPLLLRPGLLQLLLLAVLLRVNCCWWLQVAPSPHANTTSRSGCSLLLLPPLQQALLRCQGFLCRCELLRRCLVLLLASQQLLL